MGLTGVIDTFKTGTFAVTRTVAATYDTNGRVVAGSTSVVNVDASIRPLSGRDLRVLPEGHHASNLRILYSKVDIFTRTPANDPDVVLVDGENWEVLTVETYGFFDGGHIKATIARITTP